tara:strand:- start:245 stop:406 length:162 start_codon:yes stop_codon:yes gene_type:complete
MIEWLKMGGYASFVWSAYGLTGFVLSALVVHALKSRKNLFAQLKNKTQQDQSL